MLVWPGTSEHYRKIPTCLLYDDKCNVLAGGLEAKNAGSWPVFTRLRPRNVFHASPAWYVDEWRRRGLSEGGALHKMRRVSCLVSGAAVPSRCLLYYIGPLSESWSLRKLVVH
ncbi:hypothetical protein FA95DRAFT_151658 [Auriscalpium vulgare]|uniref:Uncharacterized protein n=1 Tax=Auriscalpium vulgare TaxID=40419 RepID=A0ACB8S711_9AGAM|nr:hypothetical protein FA95DRAFT_151658 [Auriscalpium vulgare]